MTDDQGQEISALAKGLLPRTTDLQAALLKEAAAPFDFETAKAVLKEHAKSNEEERLNLPRVLESLRARSDVSARERKIRALEAELRHQADEERARRAADRELAEATAFCAAHAGEVEAWRARLVEGSPFLAKRAAGKATPDLPWLVCLIHKQFGAAAPAGVRA